MDADNADELAFHANIPTQAESLQHSLKQAAGSIGLHFNTDTTGYMCFNKKGDISTLNGGSQKLENKFTYLRSSVSSIENDINMRQAKLWTIIDRLSIICTSDLSDR